MSKWGGRRPRWPFPDTNDDYYRPRQRRCGVGSSHHLYPTIQLIQIPGHHERFLLNFHSKTHRVSISLIGQRHTRTVNHSHIRTVSHSPSPPTTSHNTMVYQVVHKSCNHETFGYYPNELIWVLWNFREDSQCGFWVQVLVVCVCLCVFVSAHIIVIISAFQCVYVRILDLIFPFTVVLYREHRCSIRFICQLLSLRVRPVLG